jgi:hypothetical protein
MFYFLILSIISFIISTIVLEKVMNLLMFFKSMLSLRLLCSPYEVRGHAITFYFKAKVIH